MRVDRSRAWSSTYDFSVQLLDLSRLLVSTSEVEVTHCGRKSGFAGSRVLVTVSAVQFSREEVRGKVSAFEIEIQQRLQ